MNYCMSFATQSADEFSIVLALGSAKVIMISRILSIVGSGWELGLNLWIMFCTPV